MINHLRRWLVKDQPQIKFVVDQEMASVPEEVLAAHVLELVKTGHWRFFAEKLRRMREFHLQEIIMSTEREQIERLKGKLKTIDWILMLDKNFN